MKEQVTLMLDSKHLARLKELSRERKMSLEELIEGLMDRLPEGTDDWVEGLKGVVTGRFTKADRDDDPRLGSILK